MGGGNIIEVNIANAVSITIMAIVGALVWAAARKAFLSGKSLPFATKVSQANNDPAYMPA